MVALTAPWLPARMTLTTAGLEWRLQCLIWGMMTTRTSMMRTMMRTNLSTPCHSNKHSPSNHPHRGNSVPFFVCASSAFPLFPMPVFLSGFLRGVDEYWMNRGVYCTHPFSASESHAPAPQLWGGVVQGNCSLWPGHHAEVFVCLIHFSISHPTKKKKKPTSFKIYCCWRMYNVPVRIVIPIILQLHMADVMMIKMFHDGLSVCFNMLLVQHHGFWMAEYSCHGIPGWGSIRCVDTFCFVFWAIIWNSFIFPIVLGWVPSVL